MWLDWICPAKIKCNARHLCTSYRYACSHRQVLWVYVRLHAKRMLLIFGMSFITLNWVISVYWYTERTNIVGYFSNYMFNVMDSKEIMLLTMDSIIGWEMPREIDIQISCFDKPSINYWLCYLLDRVNEWLFQAYARYFYRAHF